MSQSLFNQIKDAKEFQGSPYVVPGQFELAINRCKQSQDRKKIEMFIVEFQILSSAVTDPSDGLRPVGSLMDWVVKFDKDAAAGNVKGFMTQALLCWLIDHGKPPLAEVDIDEATFNAIIGEANFLAGTKIRCDAYNKTTQTGGKFTRTKWLYTAAQMSTVSTLSAPAPQGSPPPLAA